MAYTAEINIAVKGVSQLTAVKKAIEETSKAVDRVNKAWGDAEFAPAKLKDFNYQLERAKRLLDQAQIGTDAETTAVKAYVVALNAANAARDRQNKLIQQQVIEQRKVVATSNAGFGVQGPALPPSMPAGRTSTGSSGRTGGAISSAIIGGGFPLLFGQGPAAAAGGALGGLAGGLLGGGFGFALSIAGTAIGDLITETDKLDVSLSGLNATLSKTGSASTTTASDVSKLAKNLQITKDEAVDLISTFSQFNSANVREALAAGFGGVGGAQTFEALAKAGVDEQAALQSIFALRKQIGNEAAQQLALQLRTVGAAQTQEALLRIISQRNISILVSQAKTVQYADSLRSYWENIIAYMATAVSLATRFIAKMQEGSIIKLPFLDRIQAVLSKFVARTPEQIAAERGAKLEKELRNQMNSIRKALKEETRLYQTEATVSDTFKAPKAPKPDRSAELQNELTAIRKISDYENKIRDLRFAGRDLAALDEETAKARADIERDRANAILKANNASEKALYLRIEQARLADLDLRDEDQRREIRQRRFEDELRFKEAVRNSVSVFEDLRKEQLLQTQYGETYLRLITQGMLPAEAARRANFEKLVSQQLAAKNEQIRIVELAILEAKAREVNTVELEKQLKLYKEQQAAIAGQAANGPGTGPTQKQRLEDALATAKGQLNELTDPINQVIAGAQAIGDAFSQAFKGLVTGAMSGQQALAAFFKGVGEHFLDMASKMIAKLIEIWILETVIGLVSSAAGGSFGSKSNAAGKATFGGSFKGTGASTFGPGAIRVPGYAEGGFVTGPTRALIGEGGQPEYVIPASKMRSAMGRYAAGARGASVIAGSSDIGGSSGQTTVAQPAAIDVRYSISRINSVDYVTADQFQAGMQQAAAQGAARGEQSALRRLQQSRSTRNRLGLG